MAATGVGRRAAAGSRAGATRVVTAFRQQPEPVKQFLGAAIVASVVAAAVKKPGAAWVGAASDVGTRASTVQFPPPNPITKAWGSIRQAVVRLTEDAEALELFALFAVGLALRVRDRVQGRDGPAAAG